MQAAITESLPLPVPRLKARMDYQRSVLFRFLFAYTIEMSGRWCTATVTDEQGRRHSLDVQAISTYDAAHLYLTHAKGQPAAGLPIPTTETVFEVVAGKQVHTVMGANLQRWILERLKEWKGPRGLLFSQRPTLE